MTTYTLNINFASDPDLKDFINKFGNVTVLKSSPATNTGDTPNAVAWQVFQPWKAVQITWVESYYLYASLTTNSAGAVIKMGGWTDKPADLNIEYEFTDDATFPAGGTFPPVAGFFSAENNYDKTSQLTFGLAQNANFGGQLVSAVSAAAGPPSPICAITVPYNTQIAFQPKTDVIVAAQKSYQAGEVLVYAAIHGLPVTFTPANTTQSVQWDPKTNTFVPLAPVFDYIPTPAVEPTVLIMFIAAGAAFIASFVHTVSTSILLRDSLKKDNITEVTVEPTSQGNKITIKYQPPSLYSSLGDDDVAKMFKKDFSIAAAKLEPGVQQDYMITYQKSASAGSSCGKMKKKDVLALGYQALRSAMDA